MSSDVPSVRTPDERFAALPGYPFTSRYLEHLPGFAGLRLHYLDEGDTDAEHTFLCLHGQPTWSYLYRRMLPIFTEAGHRVVAPDLFGFGRSDKPTEDSVYTFDFHRRTLLSCIEHLDLSGITLVMHDWGGLLGLTLPMEMPERFRRLVLMNTVLGTGDVPLSEGFLKWRAWARAHPDFEVGRLMARACPHLTSEECAAYEAPFPDTRYRAGVRRFPELVPDRTDAPGAAQSRRAAEWLATRWEGPVFMAVGLQDPVLGRPAMRLLRRAIRGCPSPLELPEAGHFVPEWGQVVARAALEAFG